MKSKNLRIGHHQEVWVDLPLKAGQRCTAIRRVIVPEPLVDPVVGALSKRLAGATLGARHLNVLARGELQAAIVGLPVNSFRYLIFAAASLATALSVTTVGVIGFIGLVVPHLVRLVAGSDHRIVLPASALAGGALLVVADTLARTIMAPRQLPVGALTAAIGVPLFLVLMSRVRQERYR